jgi:exosome complex RNA-binding protein Rrp42 (RNase PH superfamily)
VPVTVGMVDGTLLLDPSEEEEGALQGSLMCVFALPSRSLCYMRQVRLLWCHPAASCANFLRRYRLQRGGGANWSAMQVEAAVTFCLSSADALHSEVLAQLARK